MERMNDSLSVKSHHHSMNDHHSKTGVQQLPPPPLPTAATVAAPAPGRNYSPPIPPSQKIPFQHQHNTNGIPSLRPTLALPPPPFYMRLQNFLAYNWRGSDHLNYHNVNTPALNLPNECNTSSSSSSSSSNNNNNSNNHNQNRRLDPNVLMGLTIAGAGSSIIHTMMGLQTERRILFNIANKIKSSTHQENNTHLDTIRHLVTDVIMDPNSTTTTTELDAMADTSHQIMIRTTSSQKLQYDLLIRIIGTAIILYYSFNALPFQHQQPKGRRLDIIGMMGLLFVMIFLVVQQIPTLLPFYEWMRILLIVTMASPVINDTFMYDTARIRFIMSGQIVNFLTTLLVRYICESFISKETALKEKTPWLSNQHVVTNIFATCSALLFVIAQNSINRSYSMLSVRDAFTYISWQPRLKVHAEDENGDDPCCALQRRPSGAHSHPHPAPAPQSIPWYRTIRDMSYSDNIQRWIIMQILMEVQMSILYLLILYTILYEMDRDVGDTRFLWTLFRLRKVDTILIHIPMFLFGYTSVYHTLFLTLFGLSLCAYCTTNQPSNAMNTVRTLTIVYYVSCMAVHSAAFNVAMADLTLSLRYYYAKTTTTTDAHHRRSENEPNIAGIVIAYSSFICKPITYFISGLVATTLRHGRSTNTLSSKAFHILIFATIISSAIQLYVWRRYELVKHRTISMRDELCQAIPK